MRWLIIVIIIYNTAGAQQKINLPLLPAPPESKIKIPFSVIEVADARFDRSYVGAIQNNIQRQNKVVHRKIEVNFPDSFHTYFPIVLDRIVSLDSQSPEKLLILVKRFRLVDWMRSNQSDPELLLNISCSFFSVRDNDYIKLGSVDKTFSRTLYVARKNQVEIPETMSSENCSLKFSKASPGKKQMLFTKKIKLKLVSKKDFCFLFSRIV